jgi:hypothetical protein
MGGLSAISKLTNAAEGSNQMNNARLAKEWRRTLREVAGARSSLPVFLALKDRPLGPRPR